VFRRREPSCTSRCIRPSTLESSFRRSHVRRRTPHRLRLNNLCRTSLRLHITGRLSPLRRELAPSWNATRETAIKATTHQKDLYRFSLGNTPINSTWKYSRQTGSVPGPPSLQDSTSTISAFTSTENLLGNRRRMSATSESEGVIAC